MVHGNRMHARKLFMVDRKKYVEQELQWWDYVNYSSHETACTIKFFYPIIKSNAVKKIQFFSRGTFCKLRLYITHLHSFAKLRVITVLWSTLCKIHRYVAALFMITWIEAMVLLGFLSHQIIRTFSRGRYILNRSLSTSHICQSSSKCTLNQCWGSALVFIADLDPDPEFWVNADQLKFFFFKNCYLLIP
jgi:hypothetical protein